MHEGKVVRAFICRHSRRVFKPEGTYRNQDRERMEELAGMGYIEFASPEANPKQDPEQDPNLSNGRAGANPDADQDQDARLKHVGGGYYELPDGRKIRGKDEALKALTSGE